MDIHRDKQESMGPRPLDPLASRPSPEMTRYPGVWHLENGLATQDCARGGELAAADSAGYECPAAFGSEALADGLGERRPLRGSRARGVVRIVENASLGFDGSSAAFGETDIEALGLQAKSHARPESGCRRTRVGVKRSPRSEGLIAQEVADDDFARSATGSGRAPNKATLGVECDPLSNALGFGTHEIVERDFAREALPKLPLANVVSQVGDGSIYGSGVELLIADLSGKLDKVVRLANDTFGVEVKASKHLAQGFSCSCAIGHVRPSRVGV